MSRYIDADKLKIIYASKDVEKFADAFNKFVDDIPTADVRENVMGEWIDMLDSELFVFKKCSLCGETGVKTMNFCPNCGADMRGKE